MTFRLPRLAYTYEAMEPYLDGRTMELHYSRHHAQLVQRLNDVLRMVPSVAGRNLEETVEDIRAVPETWRQAFRNYAGGHLNHSLFWHILAPPAGADATAAGEPSGLLRQALESAFGNMADFRRKFADSAMSRFGAGWAWVAVDHNGEVDILTTPNEDSPIMLGYRPILGLDLWEHAYYLTYPTRREAYLDAFWHLVHWGHVAALYAHCIEMTGRIRSR